MTRAERAPRTMTGVVRGVEGSGEKTRAQERRMDVGGMRWERADVNESIRPLAPW